MIDENQQKFDHGGSGSPSTVTDHIEAAMKLLTINSKGKGKGKQMKNIFVFRPDVDYTGWYVHTPLHLIILCPYKLLQLLRHLGTSAM